MIHTDSLEFDKFKDFLKNSFSSTFGISYLDSLKPLNNLSDISFEQSLLGELLRTFYENSDLKLPKDLEYIEFYNRLKDPHASFYVNDFIVFKSFHTELNILKKSILKVKGVSALSSLLSGIFSFHEIVEFIKSKITEDARVKDDATHELSRIRYEISRTKKEINGIFNRIFARSDCDKFIQEKLIKEFSGRFVILCKTNYKQYIDGIVHSVSGSGLTFYVEPTSTVNLNNIYQELVRAEDLEIKRILLEILSKIKSNIYEVVENVKVFSKLAFIYETALVYSKHKYCVPEFGENIVFEDIHHPLILFSDPQKSVPINFEMKKDIALSVVTGPNTGGKTASIKSVGLNTIIAKCGLFIFGSFAKVINVKNILADIGDNQSLIMNLSTFSSHILNIKSIIDAASYNTLVILDEIGTGTEPVEGAALAVGVLKRLEEKGAKVIVTTHFYDIKNYALKKDNAEIYSVDFNYSTFISSYKLLKGVVGKSSPIIIAKKLNFDEKAVLIAEEYMKERITGYDITYEQINISKGELERKNIQIEKKERELLDKQEQLENKMSEFKFLAEKKQLPLLEEAYFILNKAKNILTDKKAKFTKADIQKEIQELNGKIQEIKIKKSISDEISEGDIVFLNKFKKNVKIIEIKKDNIFVDLEGMRIKLPKNEIIGEKVLRDKPKKIKVKEHVEKGAPFEIVIIGKTVEEAEDELEKFIDKALLDGKNNICIIHGRGSGKLRNGVHDYLKRNPVIKSFRTGENSEGGQAVTIVEL